MKSKKLSISCEFANNKITQQLYGPNNCHLDRMESTLGVSLHTKGNQITIKGSASQSIIAEKSLKNLYTLLESGEKIDMGDIDGSIRLAQSHYEAKSTPENLKIETGKKHIRPRSQGQVKLFTALREFAMVFALGPAGTGKTYIAVAKAVELKLAGKVDKIILSRPAVEAGERLGFLPGDMKDKIDPYLRPLYDALYDMLPGDTVLKFLESGEIEVAPIAFMRGRTLANSFVILDEAQNTTAVQMKMFLTRMGDNSRMVITGDQSQVDLPFGVHSGLQEAVTILANLKGIGNISLNETDVVRHPLVSRIVAAYEAFDKSRTKI